MSTTVRIAAAAKPCSTGNPLQKFACSWNHPAYSTTGAGNAGAFLHHNPAIIVIALAVVALLAAAAHRGLRPATR